MKPASLGVTGTPLPQIREPGGGPPRVRYPELDPSQKLVIGEGQNPWALAKAFLGPGATNAKINRFVQALIETNKAEYGTRTVFHKGDELKLPPGDWSGKPRRATAADVRKAEAQMEALAEARTGGLKQSLENLGKTLDTMAQRVNDPALRFSDTHRDYVQSKLGEMEALLRQARDPSLGGALESEADTFVADHAGAVRTLRDKLSELEPAPVPIPWGA
jgi:hypothetical protein